MSDRSFKKRKKKASPNGVTSLPGGAVLRVNESDTSRLPSFLNLCIRFLVALMGVYGMCRLLTDALWYNIGAFDLLIPCVIFTASFFALFTSFKVAPLGILGLGIGVLIMTELSGVSVVKLFAGGFTLLIARANEVMDALGYVAPTPSYYGYETEEGLITVAAVVTAFLFTICIRKKAVCFAVVTAAVVMAVPMYFYGMAKSIGSSFLILCSLCGYYAIAVSEKHGQDYKHAGYSGLLSFILAAAILISPVGSIKKPWTADPDFASLSIFVEQMIKDISNGKLPNLGWGTSIPAPNQKRTAKPSTRFHFGTEIMKVYSSFKDTVYLKTWVGGDYRDDSWYPVIWNDVKKENPELNIGMVSQTSTIPPIADLLGAYDSIGDLSSVLYNSLGIYERRIAVFPKVTSEVFAVPPLFAGINVPSGSVIYDGVVLNSTNYDKEYRPRGYVTNILYNPNRDITDVHMLDEFVEGYVQYMKYKGYVPEKLNARALQLYENYGNDGLLEESLRFAFFENAVQLVYGKDYEDVFIDMAVLELFDEPEIKQYFDEQPYHQNFVVNIPDEGYVLKNGILLKNGEDGKVYSYTLKNTFKPSDIFAIAKVVADYLDDNCKYDLSPKTTLKSSAMEDFLFRSKEGYCVQFATAGTLMLRRLGIETRYAEGYVATDFVRNPSYEHGHSYRANVYDRHAHAWAEIWINGIGWVPYEMTPPFDGMLGEEGGEITTEPETDITTDITTDTPITDPITDTTDEITDPATDETTDDITSPPITTDNDEPITEDRGGISKKTVIVAVIIAAAVGALGFTAYYLISQDKKHKKKRKMLYEAAMSCDGLNTAEREKLGADLTAELAGVLEAYRLFVNNGEQPSEFGKRLDIEMNSMGLSSLPSSFVNAMSSQIYAGIMTPEEIRTACSSLIDLRSKARKELGLVRYTVYKMKRIL